MKKRFSGKKGIFSRIVAFSLALTTILASAPVMEVHATKIPDAYFKIAADDNVTADNMNLEWTWYSDTEGASRMNGKVVSIHPSAGERVNDDGEDYPTGAKSVKIKAGIAGDVLKQGSYIKVGGEEIDNLMDVTSNTGVLIDITSGKEIECLIMVERNKNTGPDGPDDGGDDRAPDWDVTYNVTGNLGEIGGSIIVGRHRAYVENNWSTKVVGDDTLNIVIEALYPAKVTKATVDGADCTLNKDGTASISVDKKASYDVYAEAADDPNEVNILWTYDPEDEGWHDDAFIDKNTGTVEIIEIERENDEDDDDDDEVWKIEDLKDNYDDCGHIFSQNEDGGYIQCFKNDYLTFRFVPAAGYQLGSASLNGFPLEPQEEQSTFKIQIKGLLHLSGVFVKTEPQCEISSSESIKSLEVKGTDAAITTGNVAISIHGEQESPDDNKLKEAMGDDASEFGGAVETVAIDMTNIVSKGGTSSFFDSKDNYWTTRMTELSSAATLSLEVEEEPSANETFGIVREHDGKLEELEAVYDPEAKKLTFDTDKFSDYTIIKKKADAGTVSGKLMKAEDGNWYLFDNGVVNTAYTDLFCDEDLGWWKIKNGRVDFDYSDLYESPLYGWWKVENGHVDNEYTDLYDSPSYGWWFVREGAVAFDYNYLFGSPNYGWWKITGGAVDFGYTELVEDPNFGWWKVTGGQVDFGYSDIYDSPAFGKWVINGGSVDFGYNGEYQSKTYGTWKVDYGHAVEQISGGNGSGNVTIPDGLAPASDGNWYLYQNGKVATGYTDLYGDANVGWWLVTNGQVNFGYNDLFYSPEYGWWKITGGSVDFGYNELYGDPNVGWWKIAGGTVDFGYTDLFYSPTYGWWKIYEGHVDFDYFDLYWSPTYGWWVVLGGQVNFLYDDVFVSLTYGQWLVGNGTVAFDYTGDYDSWMLGKTVSVIGGQVFSD